METDRRVAVRVENVSHSFGDRAALCALDLEIDSGQVFGLLGPNGGGKTTLFRLLTTFYPIQCGRITILDLDVASVPFAVSAKIGVVFQHPSLDKKLTVAENLRHQGRMYGLTGSRLRTRLSEMLARLGVSDRANQLVETLSGGLARRVELAKGLLHEPELLILDEPSTGIDPGTRRDVWQYLDSLRDAGVTVLVTTHLMEEAEHCDRIGILDQGRLVALGSPDELRAEVGGDIFTITSDEPQDVARCLEQQLGLHCKVFESNVRFEHPEGYSFLPRVVDVAGESVRSVSVSRPTLEDVFLHRTGHRFWADDDSSAN